MQFFHIFFGNKKNSHTFASALGFKSRRVLKGNRDVAQLVSASALGAEGPPFESEYPDRKALTRDCECFFCVSKSESHWSHYHITQIAPHYPHYHIIVYCAAAGSQNKRPADSRSCRSLYNVDLIAFLPT